jgi:hypothetical protein
MTGGQKVDQRSDEPTIELSPENGYLDTFNKGPRERIFIGGTLQTDR